MKADYDRGAGVNREIKYKWNEDRNERRRRIIRWTMSNVNRGQNEMTIRRETQT